MKEFLKKLIKAKEERATELKKLIKAATTADEVRSLGDTLDAVLTELQDAKDQLDGLDDDGTGDGGDGGTGDGGEDRSGIPANAVNVRTNIANPLASFYGVGGKAPEERNADPLSTMEYRQAFATYVRTGVWKYEQRADDILVTGDIGKVIPNTIMTELIKILKSYGQLYSRVRKLNVKGGVEFPIEELIPTVHWITETTVSETQSAPELKTSVSFGYHIAEARIAQSLLSSVVSLDLLESEITKLLADAFIREFDAVIVNGSGSGQPTGILNDTRLAAINSGANVITINATNAVNWTKWRELLFAKIPLAYRGGGVLLMTVDTWESLIMTMKDTNNRPLYTETYDPVSGESICRFNGKEVILVESDLGLADYSTAATGDEYMIYLKPENYAINSNMQIGFKRYFNEDTNKWVNKGLVIMDGKLLDVNGVYIVKK